MKSRSTPSFVWFFVAAVACALPAAGAQENALNAPAAVQLASKDMAARTAAALVDREVRDPSGDKIGTVEDFILEEKSGKLVFVVVASGGFFGIGEKLRLAPFRAITPAAPDNGYTTRVYRADWRRLPLISKREFKSGTIHLTTSRLRQMPDAWYGHLGGQSAAEARAAAASQAEAFSHLNERLVRAASVRGKSVHAQSHPIGTVEDLVIDFDRGFATALLNVDPEFTGSEHDFVVPLDRLEPQADPEATLATKLSRADFQHAASGATRERPENRLTPTGRADGGAGKSGR